VSLLSLWTVLRKIGIRLKKKSLPAQERDTGANQQQRRVSWNGGVTTQMTRPRGRAPRGIRIAEATPQGHWQVLTTLAALALRGMMGPMTVESATDGDVFLAYLEHLLCPKLQAGDVVVMDNLSAHKVAGVQELITACGAVLLYGGRPEPDIFSSNGAIIAATSPRPRETDHEGSMSRNSCGSRCSNSRIAYARGLHGRACEHRP
jgi:hypothetical protein